MVFYMDIGYSTDQIKQNEEKDTESETESETETKTEIETDTENESEPEPERQPEHSETETESEEEKEEEQGEFEYELVTCGDCGNQWDGYAQCNCWEYNYNQNDTGPNDSTICREEPQEPVPTSHPIGWSPTAHYGMCGQSCPCCRAEVGDTLGACPICKKN